MLAQTSIEGGAHGVMNTWLEPWRTRSWGSGGHGGRSSAALGIRSQEVRKLGRGHESTGETSVAVIAIWKSPRLSSHSLDTHWMG